MCSIDILYWDSQHFKKVIGYYGLKKLNKDILESLIQNCKDKNIECLYFLADANCRETAKLVAENKFVLVDIRLTLERVIKKDECFQIEKWIRKAKSEDLRSVEDLSRKSFTETRFYFDGHFPLEKCKELYEIWAKKSMQGGADAVFVADYENNNERPIKGFITCQKTNEQGKIGLFAVSNDIRGKGIGTQLVKAALQWFKENGCLKVEVVTQGRNIAAQRCYQNCGFKTGKIELWYHRWFQW